VSQATDGRQQVGRGVEGITEEDANTSEKEGHFCNSKKRRGEPMVGSISYSHQRKEAMEWH